MSPVLHVRVGTALNCAVKKSAPLTGGCVGDVSALDLVDGRRVVVKTARKGQAATLDLEGWMLAYLSTKTALPVPEVLHREPDLLVMSFIETSGGITPSVEQDAADHLAQLHSIPGTAFGLERDTVIGGVPQPNPETPTWIRFFAEQRLLYMAQEAQAVRRLPDAMARRIETLCGQLDRWIEEPDTPGLIHGDLWTGNVLCAAGKIAGFVDPSIYYADPEIELAFATLFNTFGDTFFTRYAEHRPIKPDFFEVRRDLYNLYPLLVHAKLFGGSYVDSIDGTLKKFGV
ncbi:MAG: fructosamine kinase family protein [Rhodospirillaceae bacterium]